MVTASLSTPCLMMYACGIGVHSEWYFGSIGVPSCEPYTVFWGTERKALLCKSWYQPGERDRDTVVSRQTASPQGLC